MTSRWQDPEEAAVSLERLKQAVVHALREHLGGAGIHYDGPLEQRFAVVHGSPFNSLTGIRKVVESAASRREIALILEHLIAAAAAIKPSYGSISTHLDLVAAALGDALGFHPAMELRLVSISGTYEIHPSGSDELDKALVDPGLDWLATYPAVREAARTCLKALAEEDYGQSLTSARETLEMLLRSVLANDKSLENQIGTDAPFLKWLRARGVKAQTVTMTQRVIASFCDFQNDWVKHPPAAGTTFPHGEVEYAVYTVFTLVRLVSTLV